MEDESALLARLSEMPFDELERVKQYMGLKAFNAAVGKSTKAAPKQPSDRARNKAFPRANKNRPQEISSKKRPPALMPVMQVKKKRVRDPRFDENCGEFSEEHFSKSYSFLSDIRVREKQKILRACEKEKDDQKKQELKALLAKKNQEEQLEKMKQKKKEAKAKLRTKEKSLVAEGKKPYFLKKSEQRTLELAEKFKELKEAGKLEKYMEKKRKKNKAKDWSRVPVQK